jgi:antagonist of KipI
VSGTLVVLDAGLFTTVQDLGRPGYARLGVSAAGAADPVALRVANHLAGNPDGAPALEMTLRGGTFRFDTPAVVALAGADMEAEVDGRPFPCWSARAVAAGATLVCGTARRGARTCLAVGGGLAVEAVLGSASTHAPSGLGGFGGRALRRGDVLVLGAPPAATPRGERRVEPRWLAAIGRDPAVVPDDGAATSLRVTPGAHARLFAGGALRTLLGTPYAVSATSDRMGLRLDGAVLDPPHGGRMLTEGMPLGAVQVPPDGLPVILFVDHQTTGGYPVVACVVSADLARLGQLRPHERVAFAAVGMDQSRALLLRQEEHLAALEVIEG